MYVCSFIIGRVGNRTQKTDKKRWGHVENQAQVVYLYHNRGNIIRRHKRRKAERRSKPKKGRGPEQECEISGKTSLTRMKKRRAGGGRSQIFQSWEGREGSYRSKRGLKLYRHIGFQKKGKGIKRLGGSVERKPGIYWFLRLCGASGGGRVGGIGGGNDVGETENPTKNREKEGDTQRKWVSGKAGNTRSGLTLNMGKIPTALTFHERPLTLWPAAKKKICTLRGGITMERAKMNGFLPSQGGSSRSRRWGERKRECLAQAGGLLKTIVAEEKK